VYTEKPNNLKKDDKKEQDEKQKKDLVTDELDGI
jgi:hypothetical protein